MNELPDLERLREEYADRKTRLAGRDLYSFFYVQYQFAMQQRQRALIRALRWLGIGSLSGKRTLEEGCGGGVELLEYLSLGAAALLESLRLLNSHYLAVIQIRK